ncbi:hypothetical protein [Streptomyces sp. NPDC096013]|uniref:hypothetical protein n=1 Tax=Streptomyces sp. NPDC096013 TaxID=3366069 RepID=UPI00381EA63B
MITIGIDPRKSSHTAVVVDPAGHQLAQPRFVVNAGTVQQLMPWCEKWPERRFAVEDARGPGRILAQQLAAVGEKVVDVASTLSARPRRWPPAGTARPRRPDHGARPVRADLPREPGCSGCQRKTHNVRVRRKPAVPVVHGPGPGRVGQSRAVRRHPQLNQSVVTGSRRGC